MVKRGWWNLGEILLRYRRSDRSDTAGHHRLHGLRNHAACGLRPASSICFPPRIPTAELYQQYQQYGGADTITFMIQVKHGDIFNRATLQKIQDIQFAANVLPLVNHNEVLSLASYQTVYVQASPGTVEYRCYMYPFVPKNQAEVDNLRETIYAHKDELRRLVAPDYKSAAIVASFNETGPAQNYSELFHDIRAIVDKYQDANHTIYVSGEPVERGYGYYYFPVILSTIPDLGWRDRVRAVHEPGRFHLLVGSAGHRFVLGAVGIGLRRELKGTTSTR